jgi:hypothetical protein
MARARANPGGRPSPARLDARERLLASLAEAPAAIARSAKAAAATGSAEPTDAASEGDREWSIRQVVAHLALVEAVVFQVRLDQLAEAAAGAQPRWSWTEPGTSSAPELSTLEAALALFADRRAATVARVATLDEAGWRRTGLHATYGRLDVAGVLRVIVEHDAEHQLAIEARPR